MIEKRARTRGKSRRGMMLSLMLLAVLCVLASDVRAQQGWVAQRRGQPGKDLNAVYFVDAKRGWIAGDGGLVLHTEDGGSNWTQQPTGTAASLNDIYFRDKEDGYLLAGDGIFVTGDGGGTWRASTRFPSTSFGGAEPELYSVRFTSKKKGWVVGSVSRRETVVDSLVLRTADGGATWQRQSMPTRAELIHLDFDGDKRGWIVGDGGVILHTDDGGETWRLQKSNTSAALYHVDFQGNDRGWAVGERGTILRTIDGGATWRMAATPLRTTLLSIKFTSDAEGWAVGRNGVILRSEDGGQTWVQQESRTKQNLYALFLDKRTGWAVGGDGMVLRYDR
ncbi:MAG: YCF48-related protein [Pyrinomonadaceae bacterium]